MNYLTIREHIQKNMIKATLEVADLRVQPDSFSGWRIAIVSSDFEGKSHEERKKIALDGLENLTVQWLDMLTPEEQEWAGSLPIDSSLDDLPLWPEALARPSNPENILFPSDLDEDLERPIVATFYSLRGGVGRSTALAYTAQILASRGKRIFCIDMDLEAPGLAALFGKEDEIKENQGLVSLLLSLDQGERPDIRHHILKVSETDELYCLPAGLPNANYARLLNFIDLDAWYREDKNPLRELIQLLSSDVTFKPDVILLDARTGITPLNGPLLFDLADLAIIVFFPHPQSQRGTEALIHALLAAKSRRTEQRLTPEPRFIVSPVPASKAPEVIERYQHRAIEWIGDWLSVLGERRSALEPIQETDITHFVPYREEIATSDQILSSRETWRDYEAVAEWLERFLPTDNEQRLNVNLSDTKEKILEELNFSAGTAEYQERFLETFVETDLVNVALRPQIPLVLGRKGTGKTAIFRRLLEGSPSNSFVVLSPSPLKGGRAWLISPEGFKAVEKALQETKKSWREFWLLQTCLACYWSWQGNRPQPNARLIAIAEIAPTTELEVIHCIQSLLHIDSVGLLARDWLVHFDRDTPSEKLLLLDGLDTGFGNTSLDRERRIRAIEGLLSLITDLGDDLQKLKFKVLLREDIWRGLSFDNKSHFFGRSVTLAWPNKADFFRVLIEQVFQSKGFQSLVKSTEEGRLLLSNDHLSDTQVIESWNLLVGERMKGGKSAFTRNWVWNRLADGGKNHNPRTLLQLFVQAKDWENREQKQNPYWKTIIRPRALTASLEKVSMEALNALIQEEFSELQDLIDALRTIGRSPFKATEVTGFEEELGLAREVGLLSVYEGTEKEIERYKVPDLYLSGIGMTRMGQA
ncbi:P-loop ATPase, Sll1717 family [Synechocystis salina]|uniref:AAA family ATPase n=1 Tax=Synechocystis salina LEGE 00031 TaxID=1828736 RepID=A0ABR9VV66_9SYNC|nr:AAA family ATPase [Synechocystis salina]MBE9241990.1 AAA family ATPase [Synechocystis salina LEGE 00041]MBE9255240.1 AAA family ATPase [Synechocystis salina LEGE 00031]